MAGKDARKGCPDMYRIGPGKKVQHLAEQILLMIGNTEYVSLKPHSLSKERPTLISTR